MLANNLEKIFQHHKEVTFFYSGGKDSLALLLLLKPYWGRVSVVWVDTGAQFSEVQAHMEKIKALVPNFVILKGNQPVYFLENGFPVDVVSTNHTTMGFNFFGSKAVKVCSRFDCCEANIWTPMRLYLASIKPTCVLRADRSSERLKGQTQAGGIEFAFPIWEWTEEQVWEFLKAEAGDLLEERHFMKHGSSLNCEMCTAYSEEIPERLKYLKKHHPVVFEKTVSFHRVYKQEVMNELNKIEV